MKVSRLKMFIKLYEKEMKELKFEILLTLIGIVGATILAYFAGERLNWTNGLLFLTAGLAALLPVITASKIFIKEFNHNTIYLVMSLPVGGGMILGSKLAAVVTQYLAGTITFIVSIAVLVLSLFPAEVEMLLREIGSVPWGLFISFYFLSIAFGIYLVALIFFSQIVSKLVTKFQGFIGIFTLVGMFWITSKLIAPLIWQRNYNIDTIFPPLEPFVYTSLLYIGVALVIFIAAAWIYNRRVEL